MSQPCKKMRLSSPKKVHSDVAIQDLLADIDFEDDFWPEKENLVENQQKSSGKMMKSSIWMRCVVQSIERCDKMALMLQLEQPELGSTISCRLEPPWTASSLNVGDLVSIKPVWCDQRKCYRIDKDNGYMITLPDHLMAGTTMMGSLFCRRKGALQELFKGMDADNEIMMVGTIIHDILETVLKKKLTTLVEIRKFCKDYIQSPEVNYMLYSSGCTREKLADEVGKFVPKIFSFIDRYVTRKQKATAIVTGSLDYPGIIEDIEDTEENIWLPKMGLKGKIDLTVRVRSGSQQQTIPLELKTGKASFSAEHKGQVTLYQMMMEESGRNARSGLLLYLREGILREITSTRNEKRDLIILRNELARFMSRKFTRKYAANEFLEYPEPIWHRNCCEQCPYNTICTTLLKRDDQIQLSSNHPLMKCQKTAHLSEKDLDYFFRWCQISYLEDQESYKNVAVSNIWTDSMEKRIRDRKTIFGLKLKTIQEKELGEYHHVFEMPPPPADQVELRKDDYVIVSAPPEKWAIATGFIVELDLGTERITLNLGKKLSEYRDQELRVDRYESQSMLSYHLTNLGILLEDNEKGSRIRDAISGKVRPTFKDEGSVILKTSEAIDIMSKLNDGQQAAIRKALSCENYLLIQGLPGTGKTQTISSLVRLLVMSGQSVLITAHTHSAVDNLLLRLKGYGLSFLRLGSASRTHHEIRECCEAKVIADCHSPEEIASKFNQFPVVAVTCLGAGHPLLSRRQFDVCIVDEATQVVQTALLRPLFSCRRFILVGDPDQLPPVLQSSDAIAMGGDRSLFVELNKEEAMSSAKLITQYRMNKTINRLANQFMYRNELQCGSERVEKQTLSAWDVSRITEEADKRLFAKVLSPHLDLATILVDTGNVEELNAIGKRHKSKMNVNHCEVAFILRIIQHLNAIAIPLTDVGVIAPFRVQVDAIKSVLQKSLGSGHDVEVNTVDQYQGRDKEVIIYSGTKTQWAANSSNESITDSGILSDKRRLNVAITRAKKKLILLGDRKCLENFAPFQELFSYFKSPQVLRADRQYLQDIVEEYQERFT